MEGLCSRLLDGPTEPDNTGLSFLENGNKGWKELIKRRALMCSATQQTTKRTELESALLISEVSDAPGLSLFNSPVCASPVSVISWAVIYSTVICSVCCDSVPHMFQEIGSNVADVGVDMYWNYVHRKKEMQFTRK